MTIYQVMKEWTNDDGWGISSPQAVISYQDEQRARQYIYDQTGHQTALDHGYADVHIPSGMNRWRVAKHEVVE